MAIKRYSAVGYGVGQPFIEVSPKTVVSSRFPRESDKCEVSTIWVQKVNIGGGVWAYSTYVLSDVRNGAAKWRILSSDTVKKTVASPAVTVDIGSNRGSATFTGFTTAAAGTQLLTITNDWIDVGAPIMVTVQNSGANDAQMTVTQVETKDGSVEVVLTNNGAAALNGDIVITFDAMLN